MEKKKREYLFRIGSLLFLPKMKEEENSPPSYLKPGEGINNLLRFVLVVFYSIWAIVLFKDTSADSLFEPQPLSHWLWVAMPLVFAIAGIRVYREEKKSEIPMNWFSRLLIYLVWATAVIYYSAFAFHYFRY
jgi:hypothetical protein